MFHDADVHCTSASMKLNIQNTLHFTSGTKISRTVLYEHVIFARFFLPYSFIFLVSRSLSFSVCASFMLFDFIAAKCKFELVYLQLEKEIKTQNAIKTNKTLHSIGLHI